jgi:type IV pilus assembly protein PilB
MSKRLGDLLVEHHAATREEVEKAAVEAERDGKPIGEVLLAHGDSSEREVYRELAAQHGHDFAMAEDIMEDADLALAQRVPRAFLDHHRVLPIRIDGNECLVVSPDPEAQVHELAGALKATNIKLTVVTPTDYRRMRTASDLSQLGPGAHRGSTGSQGDLLAEMAEVSAELVALFDAIVLDAIAERASDIHLERYGNWVRVRLRVDGNLHDVVHYRLTATQLKGLINVIKIKAGLDIAERRMPQGGRFRTRAGGTTFDFRVQTQPSLHGEHAVIRLLPQDAQPLTIENLGFPEDTAKDYRRLMDSPVGMVLVVGPTGSGKSTTLYAGLMEVAKDESRKAITVEDPIEYSIVGIQQTQVKGEIGFQFADAMRSFVRQDPDVILVGEIRDSETALEAIRASQTGHLVLSTLHCNDSVDAVQRLFDLGMHPNSVGSELLAIFAQRLGKRICTACRHEVAPDPALVAEVFGRHPPSGFRTFRGKGCGRCNGMGFYGRIAVVELLPGSPDLRRAITKRLPVDDLRELARKTGIKTMRERALELVQDGTIAFEELPEMLSPEQMRPDALEPLTTVPAPLTTIPDLS